MVWWMTLGLALSVLSVLVYGLALLGPDVPGAYFGIVISTAWVSAALALPWLALTYAFHRKQAWLASLLTITVVADLVLLIGTAVSHAQNVELWTQFYRDNPQAAGGLPPESVVEPSLLTAYVISIVFLAAGLVVLHFVLKNKKELQPS